MSAEILLEAVITRKPPGSTLHSFSYMDHHLYHADVFTNVRSSDMRIVTCLYTWYWTENVETSVNVTIGTCRKLVSVAASSQVPVVMCAARRAVWSGLV